MTKVEKLGALREYTTDKQIGILDRLIKNGGNKTETAKELGLNESNREMQCTVYHRNRGRVGINIVNPSMLGY